MRLTIEQYAAPDFIEQFMKRKTEPETIVFVLEDDVCVELPSRRALLHTIMWRPLFYFGLVPSVHDVFIFDNLLEHVFINWHDRIYSRLLSEIPRKTEYDHMPMIEQIWLSINAMANFIDEYCVKYMNSFSALSMCRLLEEPQMRKILDTHVDPRAGTWVAEGQLKHLTQSLMKTLKDRDGLANNVLINFAETNSLRANSLAQTLIMYGPRGDIDDSISKHIIRESAFSGLRSVEDYAVESFAAKKSQFLKTEAIRRSQYSARRLRIACSSLKKVYMGSCGNVPLLTPHIIQHAYQHNYIDKVVVDGDRKIVLNQHNISKYVDTPVNLIDPCGCKYRDGVCEVCAGFGHDNLIAYLPPKIHIGMTCATKLGGQVSQTILSHKHLSSTSSKQYHMLDIASKYFHIIEDKIYWNKELFGDNKNLIIKLPIEALGPLTDLNHDMLPDCESFSEIPYFELWNDDRLIDTVQMAVDEFIPYLSEAVLIHIQDNFRSVTIDEETDTIAIPLAKFDASHEFMKYIVTNDDMVAFTESVKCFLGSTISKFTSLSQAKQSFAKLLYNKTDINFFYVEMVIKAFTTTNLEAPEVPMVTDPEQVMFGSMDTMARSAIATKLSYERLPEFFRKASSTIVPLHSSIFDRLYGFN